MSSTWAHVGAMSRPFRQFVDSKTVFYFEEVSKPIFVPFQSPLDIQKWMFRVGEKPILKDLWSCSWTSIFDRFRVRSDAKIAPKRVQSRNLAKDNGEEAKWRRDEAQEDAKERLCRPPPPLPSPPSLSFSWSLFLSLNSISISSKLKLSLEFKLVNSCLNSLPLAKNLVCSHAGSADLVLFFWMQKEFVWGKIELIRDFCEFIWGASNLFGRQIWVRAEYALWDCVCFGSSFAPANSLPCIVKRMRIAK